MTDLSATLLKILSIFGLSFFSFWPSIPAGLALGLSPLVVLITVISSYTCGVVLVLLIGQPVRDWLLKRFGGSLLSDPNSSARRIWDRFGIIGLGLVAPMTTGSQIGTIIALTFSAPPRKLLLWMFIGAILWGVLLTGAVSLGILGVQQAIR